MESPENIRGSLVGYIQHVWGFYEYRGAWFKGTCIRCGAEAKAGVNVSTLWYNCFKCGHSGKVLPMVQEMEGIPSLPELFRFLGQFSNATYKPPTVEHFPERPVVLPEGFKLLKYGEGRIGKMARKYMEGRGFEVQDLSRRGVGYVGKRKTKYFGYIIFPYYRNRKIIYFQTRRYFGSGPKFKNPTREEFGVGKSQIMYNESVLTTAKELNVVESVMNALTLGGNTVGMNGKKASSWQLTQLIKSKARLINILLDADAWAEALQLASQLVPYKQVRVVHFTDVRDVNDLGKKVVQEKIKETQVLSSFNEVMKLKWKK